MTPVISVCIANYNGIDIIDACIASVRQQGFELPVEIIVHDDASSDGSATHIRNNHPDVRLLESRDNVGFCMANNRMAAEARGDYLLLLNNDATLLPDGLRTLFEEASEIGRPAILTLPQFDQDSGELIDRGCLLDPFFNPVPNLDINRQDIAMVIGACLWIPTVLWRELGGFPEWFGSIAEDMYLCCRARLAGYPVRTCHDSGYHHRVGASFGGGRVHEGGLSTTLRRRRLSERNKTYAMITTQPLPLLFFSLPIHLLLIHIEGLLVTAIKQNPKIWREIYAPLVRELWSKRTLIRADRRMVQHASRINLAEWRAPFTCKPRKLVLLIRHGLPRIDQ